MRILSILMIMMMLSACSRIDLSDLTTAGAATAGAATAHATGLGLPATVVLTVASGVGGSALVEDTPQETISQTCSNAPEDMVVKCVRDQALINTVEEWGMWIIYGTLGFFLFTFLVGYFLPNGRQRKAERTIYNGK